MKNLLLLASSCFAIAACDRTPATTAGPTHHATPVTAADIHLDAEKKLVAQFCSPASITANNCTIFFRLRNAPDQIYGLQASRDFLSKEILIESGVLSGNKYRVASIPDECLRNVPPCKAYVPKFSEWVPFGQADYRYSATRAEISLKSLNED